MVAQARVFNLGGLGRIVGHPDTIGDGAITSVWCVIRPGMVPSPLLTSRQSAILGSTESIRIYVPERKLRQSKPFRRQFWAAHDRAYRALDRSFSVPGIADAFEVRARRSAS